MPRKRQTTVEEVKEEAKTKSSRGRKPALGKVPDIKIPDPAPSIIDEIVWFSKRTGQISRDELKDVGVKINCHKKGKSHNEDYRTITFGFRNGIHKVFGEEGTYLRFGVVKNRVYFKAMAPRDGYKITTKNSAFTSYIQATCTDEMFARLSKFDRKEYSLKYDDFQELYYIELEEEKK
jgi:hypothetical protein